MTWGCQYLGDRIIASFDGYQWWLGRGAIDSSVAVNARIAAFEPGVIESFFRYVDEARKFKARKEQGEFAPAEHLDPRHLGDGLYVIMQEDDENIDVAVNHHTNVVLTVTPTVAAGFRTYAKETVEHYNKVHKAIDDA